MKIFGTSLNGFRSFLIAQQLALAIAVAVTLFRLSGSRWLAGVTGVFAIVWMSSLSMPWFDYNAWCLLIFGILSGLNGVQSRGRESSRWLFLAGLFLGFVPWAKQNFGMGVPFWMLGLFVVDSVLFGRLQIKRAAVTVLGLVFAQFVTFLPLVRHLPEFTNQVYFNAARFKGNFLARLWPTIRAAFAGEPYYGPRWIKILGAEGIFFGLAMAFLLRVSYQAYRHRSPRALAIGLALLLPSLMSYVLAIATQTNSSWYQQALGVVVLVVAATFFEATEGRRLSSISRYVFATATALLAISTAAFLKWDLPKQQANCFERFRTERRLVKVSTGKFTGAWLTEDLVDDLKNLEPILQKIEHRDQKTLLGFPAISLFTGVYGFQSWGRWTQFLFGEQTFPEDYADLAYRLHTARPDYLLFLDGNLTCASPAAKEWAHVPLPADFVPKHCRTKFHGKILTLYGCEAE